MKIGEYTIPLKRRNTVAFGIIVLFFGMVTMSYIMALFAFIAPSIDFPLRITQVETYDGDGVARSSFYSGNLVRINASVEKATDYPYDSYYSSFVGNTTYSIIVAVMDPNRMPVFFEYIPKTISPGESRWCLFNYTISSAAVKGKYVVRVMVWTVSGDPLAPSAEEVTFTVT